MNTRQIMFPTRAASTRQPRNGSTTARRRTLTRSEAFAVGDALRAIINENPNFEDSSPEEALAVVNARAGLKSPMTGHNLDHLFADLFGRSPRWEVRQLQLRFDKASSADSESAPRTLRQAMQLIRVLSQQQVVVSSALASLCDMLSRCEFSDEQRQELNRILTQAESAGAVAERIDQRLRTANEVKRDAAFADAESAENN